MIVARRYAKALFELAREEGKVGEIGGEIRLFNEILQNTPALKVLLCGPVYDFHVKKEALERVVVTMGLSELTSRFLLLLIKKNRLAILDEILKVYQGLEDQEMGRVRARAYLPDADRESPVLDRIRSRLEEVTGKEVLLDVEEDKDMIGGVIVKIGDILIDGSVRSRLLSLKKRIREGV